MTYKEKITEEIRRVFPCNYNTYFSIVDLQAKQYKKMKKNELLNFAIADAQHFKSILESILPSHEKEYKKILTKCKNDSKYCKWEKESEKKQCGELWAIKKTIREKKEAIKMYEVVINILQSTK